MKTLRLFLYFALGASLVVAVSCASYGQLGHSRYTSPIAHAQGTVADETITIDYYAPSMHGRKIFGGLVPFDQVWCTGANWATKITSSSDLQMGTLRIPKGSHSIWTIPGEKEWTLIINKQTGQFHLNYDASRDLGRTKMEMKSLAAPVETFRIDIRAESGDKGTLALDWENTEAYIPFTVIR